MITVDQDTLRFQSFTATGELYDAFDLIKNKKWPYTLIDRKSECIPTRYFNNTITYDDQLPPDIKNIVLAKYKGFKIDKVKNRFDLKIGIYYDIDLDNDITDMEIELKLDEAGIIFEEEVKRKQKYPGQLNSINFRKHPLNHATIHSNHLTYTQHLFGKKSCERGEITPKNTIA